MLPLGWDFAKRGEVRGAVCMTREYMLSKRTRKQRSVQSGKPASKKRKPARRSTMFKSSNWFQSAARAIGISAATVAQT